MSRNQLGIVFVKKLLAGGEPCAKCRDIERRLHADGLMDRVDEIQIAREGDPASPGAVTAARHGATRAPFFVIRDPGGGERVVESYLALKRWLARGETTSGDFQDVVDRYPDIAFI